jgi:hypothetical protein
VGKAPKGLLPHLLKCPQTTFVSTPIQKDTFPIPNSGPYPAGAARRKKLEKSNLYINFQHLKLFLVKSRRLHSLQFGNDFSPLAKPAPAWRHRASGGLATIFTTLSHNTRQNRHKC